MTDSAQGVPVEQVDRDRAADMEEAIIGRSNEWTRQLREGRYDDCISLQAFAKHRLAALASVAQPAVVPIDWQLTERNLDDDCGCPEEMWDTPYGLLHMHLAAGRQSNACIDNGDEGERHVNLTAPSVEEARIAFFAWAAETVTSPAQIKADAFERADDLNEAIFAGQTVLAGEGDGTYDEACRAISELIAAIRAEARVPASDGVRDEEHFCPACPIGPRDLGAVLHNLAGQLRRGGSVLDARSERKLQEAEASLARWQPVVDAHFSALAASPPAAMGDDA